MTPLPLPLPSLEPYLQHERRAIILAWLYGIRGPAKGRTQLGIVAGDKQSQPLTSRKAALWTWLPGVAPQRLGVYPCQP